VDYEETTEKKEQLRAAGPMWMALGVVAIDTPFSNDDDQRRLLI
jgi:hypothetical protein